MSAVITLWKKHMVKYTIHTEEAFGTLFQPILWVVLFGTGMKAVFSDAIPDLNYIAFMVPGIVALTAMSGAIQGGLTFLQERLLGTMKEYLVAPIPRISILGGNALSTTTTALLQSIIILIIGMFMGAQLDLLPFDWLGGIVLVTGFTLGFAGIGLAVAAKASSIGGYHMLIFMLTLPLMFVSNALYPLPALPTWMKFVAQINPMSYVVDGLRQTVFISSAAVTGGTPLELWLCYVVVIVFAAFGMGLAYMSFKGTIK